jgi:hypothetical protein
VACLLLVSLTLFVNHNKFLKCMIIYDMICNKEHQNASRMLEMIVLCSSMQVEDIIEYVVPCAN